jgi:hypothetical protein
MDMAVGAKRHRKTRIALGALGALVLLVVLAQAFLPALAAKRVEDRVARYGTVHSAHVSAFPAVELLWGKADSVTVHAGALTVSATQIGSLMWEARAVHDMTLTAASVNIRAAALPAGLTMSGVRMEKRGSFISTSATLTQKQLDGALPSGFRVQPIASGEGEMQVRASGGLFGVQASIEALVRPLEGKLVAEPRGFPLAGIATVTLFSDPHLKVQSIGVRVLSQTPLAYGLSLSAILR